MDNNEKLNLLLDYIDVEHREDGLYITMKDNVHIDVQGSLVHKMKGDMIFVTNHQNGGLMYLNPHDVSYDDGKSITQASKFSKQSYLNKQQEYQEKISAQSNDENCSDCSTDNL